MKLDGYSNYEIDVEQGTVYSYKSNRYIGSVDKNKGYIHIDLIDDNGEKHKWLMHRFIWTCVYGEIPEGMTVNHINEDKSVNGISNLNLMTVAEQNVWGTRLERYTTSMSKPVGAYLNDKLVMTFTSTQEAQRNGFSSGSISSCCNGKVKEHKGYVWKYLDN